MQICSPEILLFRLITLLRIQEETSLIWKLILMTKCQRYKKYWKMMESMVSLYLRANWLKAQGKKHLQSILFKITPNLHLLRLRVQMSSRCSGLDFQSFTIRITSIWTADIMTLLFSSQKEISYFADGAYSPTTTDKTLRLKSNGKSESKAKNQMSMIWNLQTVIRTQRKSGSLSTSENLE